MILFIGTKCIQFYFKSRGISYRTLQNLVYLGNHQLDLIKMGFCAIPNQYPLYSTFEITRRLLHGNAEFPSPDSLG